jgi:filamentous hemagglutinin family protein
LLLAVYLEKKRRFENLGLKYQQLKLVESCFIYQPMRLPLVPFSALATLTTIVCAVPLAAIAQIVPDNTLGSENSVVVPNQNIRGIDSDRIDGGAVRGGNLFHSFEEFNIDEGRGAYFSNPDNIVNILSRVTGGNVSEILGTLGVLGNANLFLINPNGIVFGPNARLDVGGSFFASTADGILFENGVEFAASNPEAPPLLTINMPIGLNLRENPGTIVNQTVTVDSEKNFVGLQVPPKRTLGLVGGDIQIEGGILTAPQGRIELGSVEGNSFVSLNTIDKGYAISYEGVQNFRDISLSQEALVDVRGEGGGDIQVQGRQVSLTESSVIEASTQGSEPGGLLSIRASESVEVVDSDIFANLNSGATGKGGNIIINTQNLLVQNGSQVSASTFGNGDGGILTITATDVEIVDSYLFALVGLAAIGNGDTLTINTQHLTLQDGAQISTSTFGNGNAGDLFINTQNLQVRDASVVAADTFAQGDAGQLIIKATDFVEVRDALSFITTNVESGGVGNGGTLIIDTQRLSVRDGAQIGAATGGRGNGGDLTITANDIEIVGTAAGGASSIGVSVEPGATGNGGTLTINTQRLLVQDGAQVSVGTFGNGDGGDLIITTIDMEVIGAVVGTSVQLGAVGNGGNMTIHTQRLVVKDGAQVLASTFGNGDGGNLIITANTIELIGASSGLFTTVEPRAVGNAGTLTIDTQRLEVKDSAQISAATNGQGDGANLTINATDVELIGTSAEGQLPSGLFTSVDNGATGNGGTLTLNTQRLTVRDGAQITTTTFVNGDAGDLIINATDIELVGTSANGQTASGLFADVEPESTGKGGELTINADNLIVQNGARIDVRSEGIEAAGNLEINAPTILLDNEASFNAETTAGQGNIIINTSDLRLRNNSNITTNATGEATGGNIEINTDNLIAIEDSDISANAQAAFGGQVIINADAIFGTEFRQQQTGASDITATSELGASFSGTVELNSEIDPAQGLVDLPQSVVDPAALIAQDPCIQGRDSSFIITGRGGIAPDPTQPLSITQGLIEWESFIVEPTPPQPNNSSQRRQQQSQKRDNNHDDYPVDSRTIVPARGWIRTEDGEVILVSYDPTKMGVQRQPNNPHTCQSSN